MIDRYIDKIDIQNKMQQAAKRTVEKIAVIDLGSNSARLIISEVIPDGKGGGYCVTVDELKEQVRLGQDLETDGYLKPARIAGAVKVLKMMKKLCESHKVVKVYPFATNAVRRAKNQRSFLEEVYTITGFKFRVLLEEEEATHIYHGVVNSLDIPKGLIIDMSGSSTQLICYNRRNILFYENLPFGTITLYDRFSTQGISPEQHAEQMEKFALEQFRKIEWLKEIDPETVLIGCGGSFRNLARICRRMRKYPLPLTHNFELKRDDFNTVYEKMRTLESTDRAKIKGLSSQRADIFMSALSTLNAFFTATGFEMLHISGCGIREGVLMNHTVPSTIEKPINDILWHSVYSKLKHYGMDIKHAEHVKKLCDNLYKELRVLHKLPRQYIKVLRVAALLHDTGLRVRFYDHHKHSMYFILNSSINGLSHREIVLAAFTAYGHREHEFDKAEFLKYSALLRDEDYNAVRKLGLILRLAESLDRPMRGSIVGVECDVLGDSAILKTKCEADCALEIRDALNVSSEFARIFKKNLEIL